MRVRVLFALLFHCLCSALLAQTQGARSPKLLLTAQRLRRLQRDRQRQTVRWTNFENRVHSVSNSPERGFELALYYAITRDPKAGNDAAAWAIAHPCERRQLALILDWVPDQLSEPQRSQLLHASCRDSQGPAAARDALFFTVATGDDAGELIHKTGSAVVDGLQAGDWRNGAHLYAALEYLYTARSVEHADLREQAREFFATLPAALLLGMRPGQMNKPDWHTHIAALALIAIDPNLTGSQFLQGWAMEDRQMLHDGEGVAYELLWADPYLPGVGYENLDPWLYRAEEATLFARTDWNDNACWIHISRSDLEEENCPAGWQQKSMSFGRLTLLPMSGTCLQLPEMKRDDSVILWKLKPGGAIFVTLNDAPTTEQADASGMWKPPGNARGRVCTSLDTLKVPKARKSTRE